MLWAKFHLQMGRNSVYVELVVVDLICEPALPAHFERQLVRDYLTQLDVGAWIGEVGFYSAFRSYDKNKVDYLNE